jgi:hypothetical protein
MRSSLLLVSLALATPLAAQDTVSLASVRVDLAGMVHVTYSKNFATCAHLMTQSRQLVHTQNHFCTSGNDVVVSLPLSAFNAPFAVGVTLILCHGNNYGVCSSPVRVTCAGEYGQGCAGTGGQVPALGAADGCPQEGTPLDVTLADGLPGANAAVFFGNGAASIPFLGCTVHIVPLPISVPMTLDGTGKRGISIIVPPGASGGSVTLQGFVVDPGGPQGISATNGYRVDIP